MHIIQLFYNCVNRTDKFPNIPETEKCEYSGAGKDGQITSSRQKRTDYDWQYSDSDIEGTDYPGIQSAVVVS